MTKIARLDVRTVRKLMAQGMSIPQIAKKYGVTKQAVYQRLKADDERKGCRDSNNYGLDVVKSVGSGNHDYHLIDPETGLAVNANGNAGAIIARMGDEKVSQFVTYHMEMLKMREGADKNDVDDLFNRFVEYLMYCAKHGIIPNNMNCYFALGVSRQNISSWKNGTTGTPRHKEFAQMISDFFASVHEQAATDGIVNPIYSMWLQKAHDNMIEAQKVEVVNNDPMGERRSAEEIAKSYNDLPD